MSSRRKNFILIGMVAALLLFTAARIAGCINHSDQEKEVFRVATLYTDLVAKGDAARACHIINQPQKFVQWMNLQTNSRSVSCRQAMLQFLKNDAQAQASNFKASLAAADKKPQWEVKISGPYAAITLNGDPQSQLLYLYKDKQGWKMELVAEISKYPVIK